jgi:thiol-disulfide isomerase/thioredoxin
MKKALLFLLITGLVQAAVAQQYLIRAEVTGFPDNTKFYLKDLDVDSDIDSAVLKNNRFEMRGKISDAPKSLWIYASANKNSYYTTLLIGNDNLTIKGDAEDFPFDLSITGSKIQDVHNLQVNLTKANYKKRNQLLQDYFTLKGDSAEIKGKQIWKVIGKLDSADDAVRKAFILSHLNTYEGLHELFYLKNKFPKDSLQQLYTSLTPEFKRSQFAQRIATYLKVGNILKKGDNSVDFEALDKNGQKHRLTDFKGKYVLLDFSTTYCGPCIQSLTDLHLMAKQYKDELAIVTFSGDGGKDTWLKGLNRDQPAWLSLWDGKGPYGETILKYGVTGYPTFVLIGPEGKIISKWSGYGKNKDGKGSLETAVAKLMPAGK